MFSRSIVAGGGRGSPNFPHWLEYYAKYRVFSTFEADFCSTNDKSNWNETWWRTWDNVDQKKWVSAYMMIFFFFFGDYLKSDRKNLWISVKVFFSFFFFLEITWNRTEKLLNFGEDLFSWDLLKLARKNRSFCLKANQTLGQDRLISCLASKTAPPPPTNPNSWLRYCFHVLFQVIIINAVPVTIL